jgi:long-chain acyl-CoA synthetase
MAGVEVRLGDDGEILTRGPHVMRGYYKNEEKTREVIDEDGWFRTGDIGTFTDTGLLKITDRKKDLFKLSTGKYVMPQPIENKLADVPFIDRAVVVGAGHKYCAALIFPSEDALRAEARDLGLDAEMRLEHLVKDPEVLKLFERAVEEANAGMDHWSTVKRFVVVPDELTVESELLTPTMKVKRRKISDAFAGDIEALYREDEDDLPKRAAAVE